MRELESSFDESTSAMERNRKKSELLEKQIKNQEKQVEELEKGLKASAEKYGENSAETNRWRQAVNNARTDLNRMRSDLNRIPRSLQAVGQQMQKVGKKMQAVGSTMTKYITGPIVGMATASVAAFKEVDAGMDIVTKKTGATGQALIDLQESARNIATTIPTSFDTAGAAIGEVNTKFGLVGEDLEELSTKFIKFADLNDTDVSNAVDKTQKVMQAFGLETEDAGKLLDTMNKVGQNTGISMDTLSTTMVKNAAALRDMGMDAHDAAQFLGSVEMSGANTADVMKGMQKAMSEAAKDGMTLPEKLEQFNSVMQSGKSDAEKLSFAMETFGTKAGEAIYNAYQDGSLNFENLAASAEEFAGNIDQTYSDVKGANDDLTTSFNKIKDAGARIGEEVVKAIAPAVERVADFAQDVGTKFGEMDQSQQDFVLAAVGAFALGGPVVNAFGKTVEAAGRVAVKVGGLVGKLGEVSGASETLGGAASALAGAGGPLLALTGTVAWAAFVVKSMINPVKTANEDVTELVKTQEENLKALDSALEGVNTAITTANEDIQAVNDQAEVALAIIDELEALESQSDRTAEEEARMKTLVDQLNAMYPDLKVGIDKSTGALSKSTTEIRKYVKAAKDMALLEAYSRASASAMDALVEANNQLYLAEKGKKEIIQEIADQRKAYEDMIATNKENPYTYSAAEIQEVVDGIDLLGESLEASNQAVEEGKAAVAEATEVVEGYSAQYDALSEKVDEETAALEENTDATSENTKAQNSARDSFVEKAKAVVKSKQEAVKAMQEEQDKWDELYNATKESIEGQVRLFDGWKEDTELTFHDVMKSMNDNIIGMRKYSKNLQKLSKWALENGSEEAKAFVQYIADMGIEGASVAEALVEGVEKEGRNINDAFAKYGKATGLEENLSGIITYINSDFLTKAEAGAKAFNGIFAHDKLEGLKQMKANAVAAFEGFAPAFFGKGKKAGKEAAEGMTEGVEEDIQSASLRARYIAAGGKVADGINEGADKGLETMSDNIVDTATTASEKASKDSKNIIDKTKYEPEIKAISVTDAVLQGVKKKIETSVDPTIKVGGLDVGAAVASARQTMQDWFNRNPIIAKLKGGSVAHNANGGIITNETLSWLAEGNQPEAVIPLSASKRSRALELYEQTGQALGVDSLPRPSSSITIPGTASSVEDGRMAIDFDADKLYEAVAQGAAAGMESANIRIYWDNREAGRIMRDMGVQFA